MCARNVAGWIVSLAGLCLATVPAMGQMAGPLTNTTVGNARLIVPDGTSLRQAISTGETRWFVFGAEPGKTYVVEAVDPDSDLGSDTIGAMNVYAANGTTTPPAETNVNCTAATLPPAVEVVVNGVRCVVRTFPPTPGNTQNARGIYVGVGSVTGPSFQIRVRESTIYGRWTTNGYDFHTELENTTAQTVCAEIQFLPNSGDSYAATWSGGLATHTLLIPPFGANKYVFPNGTLVGTANDNRGTLRIGACATPTNLVPGALHVSTYAYNTTTGGYLYFFTTPANNGAASNSWTAASGGGSGTVTSVATGPGLTGGPITASGTINLAATNLLPTVSCALNQIPKWNGSAWACQNDANSGGTVTSVATGTGLTGGPITGSGTINLAGTQLLPAVACAADQIPKWNGSAWACAADNGTNAFVQGGNAFGATAVLGTTDNTGVEIDVNGSRAMRYEPTATSPNVIGGHVNNGVYIGVFGASIAGGGAAGLHNDLILGYHCTLAFGCLNGVTDAWGTIGGGAGNQAGNGVGTTSDTPFATVAGGFSNWALEQFSSVGGGLRNAAAGGWSTVAGGSDNTASGLWATVPGGQNNTAAANYSFAAGSGANIPASAEGTFFWNDSQGGQSLAAGAHDEFIVIATNGIGMYTYKDFSHGCVLIGAAGSWSCTSDQATKSNFTAIEPRDILARLVAMPITQWRWKGEAETVRHVGPTAQDFRAAFDLGYDDKTITLVDTEGIALAAIQGLYAELKDRDTTIAKQQSQMAQDESRIAEEEREIEKQQREIAELRERVAQVDSLRGELAALRNAIAAATGGATVAAQADTTVP